MNDRRNELLERAKKYRFVPGHGPDIDRMTDDELETLVRIMESAFRMAFRDEEDEGN